MTASLRVSVKVSRRPTSWQSVWLRSIGGWRDWGCQRRPTPLSEICLLCCNQQLINQPKHFSNIIWRSHLVALHVLPSCSSVNLKRNNFKMGQEEKLKQAPFDRLRVSNRETYVYSKMYFHVYLHVLQCFSRKREAPLGRCFIKYRYCGKTWTIELLVEREIMYTLTLHCMLLEVM